MDFGELAKTIGAKLKDILPMWDGKQAILEMKNAGYNQWRQTEWIGFYFQFLCEKHLNGIMKIPDGVYGNTTFDGFKQIPWDFKTHVIDSGDNVVVNDTEATLRAINDYGEVGLILALGFAEYNDEDGSFKNWHDELKGGLSDYSKERIARKAPSRLRKVKFKLKKICFIKLNAANVKKSGSFQKGFRNADGSPRREKVMINLEEIKDSIVYCIEF
jgi:hypothetical protein